MVYRICVPVLIFEVFLYNVKFTFPIKTLQMKIRRLNLCLTENKMCFHKKDQTSIFVYESNCCLLHLTEHIKYYVRKKC